MQNKKVYGYTLLHLLGQGGMAEVWYAENEIGKEAAVKFLLPKYCSDMDVLNRFRAEAEVMVKLDHPNIRKVYDYGEVEGRPCMVMEYLEGEDLSARIKQGERFTDEQLRQWWDQLASALNYTHKQGVVHRDIKPSNIFVTTDGEVKLLDFGIAKVRDSIVSTHTGAMMGTLMYMSPEQVRDSKHIDHKTDLYSLAVTFVHLLTGNAPYDRNTTDDFEIRNNIVNVPLNTTGLPVAWRNFLRPYLAKKSEERPALTAFRDVADVMSDSQAMEEPPVFEETVVDGITVAGTGVRDEETMAESRSAEVRKGDWGKSVSSGAPSHKRKAWPWVLLVIVAAVVAFILLRGYGDDTTGSKEQVAKPAEPESSQQEGEFSETVDKTSEDIFQNKTFTVNGVSFTMVAVEGGNFKMGGTDDNVKSNEKPCHDVSLSDFYMGETEVTQALWQAVMGNTISNQRDKAKSAYPSMNFPMRGMGDDYPMYYVSWEECQKFVTALNEKVREQLPKGWQFALPTESQWEYAARGGKQGGSYYKYSGSEKIDEVAWYSAKQAHPVKKKKANELGLYDMSGNVWEWCQDWYGAYGNSFQSDPVGPASGRSCVLRGGSWRYGSDYCRVSNRGDSGDSLHGISSPGFRISYYGFRLSLVRK